MVPGYRNRFYIPTLHRKSRETEKGQPQSQRSGPAAHGEALCAGRRSSRGPPREERQICADRQEDLHPHQSQNAPPAEKALLQTLRQLSHCGSDEGEASRRRPNHHLPVMQRADEATLPVRIGLAGILIDAIGWSHPQLIVAYVLHYTIFLVSDKLFLAIEYLFYECGDGHISVPISGQDVRRG